MTEYRADDMLSLSRKLRGSPTVDQLGTALDADLREADALNRSEVSPFFPPTGEPDFEKTVSTDSRDIDKLALRVQTKLELHDPQRRQSPEVGDRGKDGLGTGFALDPLAGPSKRPIRRTDG